MYRILVFFLFFFSFFPSTAIANPDCEGLFVRDGTVCVLRTIPGERVTYIFELWEGARRSSHDWATIEIPGYLSKQRLEVGKLYEFSFTANSSEIKVNYYINNYEYHDFLLIEGRITRTNLVLTDVRMDEVFGDIQVAYKVEGEVFIPKAYVCIDIFYGKDNIPTQYISTKCLDHCVGKKTCEELHIILRADRPVMGLGDNQIIAKIDAANLHPESNENDNIIYRQLDVFEEEIHPIMRNLGFERGAKTHIEWLNGAERIANLSRNGGFDFTGKVPYLKRDIITIDYILANEPLFAGYSSAIADLLIKRKYKNGGALDAVRDNIETMRIKFPGSKVIPISDLSKRGLHLFKQTARTIPTAQYHNPLTDVYATVGRVGIRGIPTGTARRITNNTYEVIIDGVGIVIFDSFDFQGADQPLGCWGKPIFGPGPIPGLTTCVWNSSFQKYRIIKKRGGDFITQTDVKLYPLPPSKPFIVQIKP